MLLQVSSRLVSELWFRAAKDRQFVLFKWWVNYFGAGLWHFNHVNNYGAFVCFVLHILRHIRTSSWVKKKTDFPQLVTPRRWLCLGINLVYSFYCLTCFFLIIERLRAFLINVKSKVREHSYLQPRSWLRSICDLLPWPRELAGISTTGLTLDYSSSAFSISSNSLSSCFLPGLRIERTVPASSIFFHSSTKNVHASPPPRPPKGWQTINSPLSSESWRGPRPLWRCYRSPDVCVRGTGSSSLIISNF